MRAYETEVTLHAVWVMETCFGGTWTSWWPGWFGSLPLCSLCLCTILSSVGLDRLAWILPLLVAGPSWLVWTGH